MVSALRIELGEGVVEKQQRRTARPIRQQLDLRKQQGEEQAALLAT